MIAMKLKSRIINYIIDVYICDDLEISIIVHHWGGKDIVTSMKWVLDIVSDNNTSKILNTVCWLMSWASIKQQKTMIERMKMDGKFQVIIYFN